MNTRMNERIRGKLKDLVDDLIFAPQELEDAVKASQAVLDAKIISIVESVFLPGDLDVLERHGCLRYSNTAYVQVVDDEGRRHNKERYYTDGKQITHTKDWTPQVALTDIESEFKAFEAARSALNAAAYNARKPYKDLISTARTVEDVAEAWQPAARFLGPGYCTAIMCPVKDLQAAVRADWEARRGAALAEVTAESSEPAA